MIRDRVKGIRLVLLCDVRLYREGLANALGRFPHVHVVGTAAGHEELLGRLGELQPHVILFDMTMNDALATVRLLAQRAPLAKVVAFAVTDVEHDVLTCAEAGERTDVQTQEDELAPELVIHLLEIRHLGPARRAESRPEVEHHRLPLAEDARKLEFFSAERIGALVEHQSEIRRGDAWFIGRTGRALSTGI